MHTKTSVRVKCINVIAVVLCPWLTDIFKLILHFYEIYFPRREREANIFKNCILDVGNKSLCYSINSEVPKEN